MTPEAFINAALEAKYLGKTIAGGYPDDTPFVVKGARFSQDYDYCSVEFWNCASPVEMPLKDRRLRGVGLTHDQMPEILFS